MAIARDTVSAKEAKAACVRAALTAFLPQAEVTESILENGAPGHEQVILWVAIPGLRRADVMSHIRAFERMHAAHLPGMVDHDVCVVSRPSA